MADMGAPIINQDPAYPPSSKYSRPYARFRAVGAVVLATFRFRYVIRRKLQYLQSKMAQLDPAMKREAIFNKGNVCVKTSIDVPFMMVNGGTSYGSGTFSVPAMPLTPGGLTGEDTDLGGIGINSSLSHFRTKPPHAYCGTSKFVTTSSNPVLSSGTDTHYLKYSDSRRRDSKTSGSKIPHRRTKKGTKSLLHL